MRLATPGAVRRVPPHPAATPRPTDAQLVTPTPYLAVTQPGGGHR
ncbi:hypothetical protein ABZY16_10700 [Streptomyces sp. NPDC006553]